MANARVHPQTETPYELTITRTLDAPRALVFRMWAEQEHMGQWFRPEGFTIPDAKIEFVPGGVLFCHMRSPEGSDHRMRGVYREIVPNERIVFTFSWVDEAGETDLETLVTVSFEDDGDGTKLTVHHVGFETADQRDSHHGGWTGCLGNLTSYLEAVA